MNNEDEHQSIINALNAILQYPKFQISPKSSSFLQYVVHQTLDGNAERIKAYTIAVDALGKPPGYDPSNNPSVRVLALRVRRTLDEYYDKYQHHEVIIKLEAGSYVPRFLKMGEFDSRGSTTDVMSTQQTIARPGG